MPIAAFPSTTGYRPRRWRVPYPRTLALFVLVAALDLLVTANLLAIGGDEANPIARAAYVCAGVLGMALLKGASVAVVAAVAHYIGTHRRAGGQLLLAFAAVVTAYPVVLGLSLIQRAVQFEQALFEASQPIESEAFAIADTG